MSLLLDTHVLIWALAEEPGLASAARSAIWDEGNDVAVSPVSAWEIEIKRSVGKLDVPHDLVEELANARFSPLSITIDHALAAGRLPLYHRDPFDRMLIAQAQIEGLTIVTRDSQIEQYDVPVMRA